MEFSFVILLGYLIDEQEKKKQPKKIQSTLTQTIFKSTKHDEKLESMTQENMKVFESTLPAPSKCSHIKPAAKVQASSKNSEQIQDLKGGRDIFVATRHNRRTIPFAVINQKFNQSFASITSTNTNSFGIMLKDVTTDINTPDKYFAKINTKQKLSLY